MWKTLAGQSDFITLLKDRYPHLYPSLPAFPALGDLREPTASLQLPHGTTILAVRFQGGVIIAGDRQATEGYQVADRHIEKVYETDDYSAIAIAGVAGPAIQMAKLLRTQLEFYEKVEGAVLSLEGKANYLSHLLRQNLPAAFQGLIVVPIFAGYDLRRREGRIFKYDVTGGRYEELDYYATGSGGKDARGTFKKRYRPNLNREDALHATIEALLDASDEDTATGGVDLIRGIWPTVKVITEDGAKDALESELRPMVESLTQELRRLSA